MISNLVKKILLNRPPAFSIKLSLFNSNKKSIDQQSYFESRKRIYDSHQYPPYKPTISIKQFLEKYVPIKTDKEGQNSKKSQQLFKHENSSQAIQRVVGRISAIRKHGKTTFIDIREQHLRLQVTIKTEKQLLFNRGDIIGVQGQAFYTKKGELSINCTKYENIILLSPCMWMLPQHEGLKDAQVRFRNKHIDLITNKNSLEVIKKRSKIISSLRSSLIEEGYIEVQTPILSPTCGGAIAKPFITYHNDHKSNLFLRIAPELYLKQLLVGGILKVFQIGKNFRNQSIDQTHNPEFTSCQLYCAYEDYRGMIQFTHKLINRIAISVNGTTLIKGKNQKGQIVDIDLSQKWKQIDFIGGLEEALSMKLPIDFQNPQTIQFYDQLCIQKHVPCEEPRSIQRLLDKLAGKYLQTTFEPFIIMNHPKVMSPLAKPIPELPHLTQRFELFINGWEVVNSYTQLNDPRIQKQNTPSDTDFVQALEYGLMPCAGWGIGLDRLIMLLTQKERIQQVIAFPLLRQMLSSTNKGKPNTN